MVHLHSFPLTSTPTGIYYITDSTGAGPLIPVPVNEIILSIFHHHLSCLPASFFLHNKDAKQVLRNHLLPLNFYQLACVS